MRFSDDEIELIQRTFGGNLPLIKLLRKVFLPFYDPKAPIGQVVDLWMTIDVRNMTPQDAYVRLLARNELIAHIEQQLLQIQVLSANKKETPEALAARQKKDSAK